MPKRQSKRNISRNGNGNNVSRIVKVYSHDERGRDRTAAIKYYHGE